MEQEKNEERQPERPVAEPLSSEAAQDVIPEAEEAAAAEEDGRKEEEKKACADENREAREMYDKFLRLAAEFENYKKRIEREKAVLLDHAEEHLIKALLPSLDNLEMAIEQGRQPNSSVQSLLEGVELTCRGLRSTLEKIGVKAIESNGQTFDPRFHEAMATEVSNEVEANKVIREYQKGYLFKERLIRPAKVVVTTKGT